MNVIESLSNKSSRIFDIGTSYSSTPDEAVCEAVKQLDMANIGFVLVFVPDGLNLDQIANSLLENLPTKSVFGCTTAGQITTNGYESNALVLISFPKRHFRCSSTLIKPLKPVSIEETAKQVQMLASRFGRTANWNRIALTFADGLSKQEDVLVAALQAGLDDVPVFGGSAAHGLAFDETFVLHGGVFHNNAALLLLLETDLEFRGLGFDHFLPTDKRMVVTKAVPDERLVQEINGSPAAIEYARLIDHEVQELSPKIFAENPVLVRSQSAWHVRAIQQVTENNGLSFLCAIDDGLILTLGKSAEILKTLDSGLAQKTSGGGEPEFILGFDCFLRKLEIEQNNLTAEASALLRKHKVIGFNTYGEQHRGVHVNQTFVGVAFYAQDKGTVL